MGKKAMARKSITSRDRTAWRRAGLLVVLLVSPGFSQSHAKEYVAAVQADHEIPEEELLDVGIQVFHLGLPGGDESALEDRGLFAGVRKSEARYIPFQLKDTLESTGHWGAVRVVPAGMRSDDVTISGEIVESTGHELVVRVRIGDSRGRVWRDRKYRQEVDPHAYNNDGDQLVAGDPYQSLYNRIVCWHQYLCLETRFGRLRQLWRYG